jgi:hypothetical protein
MGAAAGNGMGTSPNYLRGTAGNGRAHRSSTFDAQRAPPRATAGRNNQVPAMHSERRRGQPLGHHGQVPATHNERRRGQRPGATAKYLRRTTSGAAGNGMDTAIKYLRAAAGIGLGTTIKYLRDRRTTSAAAGNGLGTTMLLVLWLTIQNTANWHVNNAFGLLYVFISFPLARAAAAVAAADFVAAAARPDPPPPPLFGGEKYQKNKIACSVGGWRLGVINEHSPAMHNERRGQRSFEKD